MNATINCLQPVQHRLLLPVTLPLHFEGSLHAYCPTCPWRRSDTSDLPSPPQALLWVPPTNPLNTYRLTITFLIALPGFKVGNGHHPGGGWAAGCVAFSAARGIHSHSQLLEAVATLMWTLPCPCAGVLRVHRAGRLLKSFHKVRLGLAYRIGTAQWKGQLTLRLHYSSLPPK